MFNFDKSDVQRIVTAAIGALILSTAMVVSAVGPARAIETSPVAVAAVQISAEAHA